MGATAPSMLTGSARSEFVAREAVKKWGTAADLEGFNADVIALRKQFQPPLVRATIDESKSGFQLRPPIGTFVPLKEAPDAAAHREDMLARGIAGLSCKYLKKYGEVCQDNWADMVPGIFASVVLGALTAGIGTAIGGATGAAGLGQTIGEKGGALLKREALQDLYSPPAPAPRPQVPQTVPTVLPPSEDPQWVVPVLVGIVALVVLVNLPR